MTSQTCTVDLGGWLEAHTGHRNLVGRAVGRACVGAIEAHLRALPEGRVLRLDVSRVEVMEFTGADSCVATLISRLVQQEYGDVFVVLTGTTASHESNIGIALTRRKLAALVQAPTGMALLGHLDPFLRGTFDTLIADETWTAREVAAAQATPIGLVSDRLRRLYEARLLCRAAMKLPTGGHQFVYALPQAGATVVGLVPDREGFGYSEG